MATEKRFLLNVNSKKIHDLERIDGRCKIKSMREDYMVYFDSLEEALGYTLQNGAGRYLSASGGSLRLSDSPFVWYACVAGKDAFSLRPDSDRTQAIDISNAFFEVGNPVSIFESNGHTAQHWRLWSVGGGRWLIVSAEDPELALCASGSGFVLL